MYKVNCMLAIRLLSIFIRIKMVVSSFRKYALATSNEALAKMNEFSEKEFELLEEEFQRNTRMMREMKKDLEYIFQKLKYEL